MEKVGKIIKDTKNRHVWSFVYNHEYFEVKAFVSKISSKFRVLMQGQQVLAIKMNDEFKRKGAEVVNQGIKLLFMKEKSKLKLFINNELFVPHSNSKPVVDQIPNYLSKASLKTDKKKIAGEKKNGIAFTVDPKEEDQSNDQSEHTYQIFKADDDEYSDDDGFANFQKSKGYSVKQESLTDNINRFKSPGPQFTNNPKQNINRDDPFNIKSESIKVSGLAFSESNQNTNSMKSSNTQNFVKTYVKPPIDENDFLNFEFEPKNSNTNKSQNIVTPYNQPNIKTPAIQSVFNPNQNINNLGSRPNNHIGNSLSQSEPPKLQFSDNQQKSWKMSQTKNESNFDNQFNFPPQKQQGISVFKNDPFGKFEGEVKFEDNRASLQSNNNLEGPNQKASPHYGSQRNTLNSSSQLHDSKLKFKNFDFGQSTKVQQPSNNNDLQNPPSSENFLKYQPLEDQKEQPSSIKQWPAFTNQNEFVPNSNPIFENAFPSHPTNTQNGQKLETQKLGSAFNRPQGYSGYEVSQSDPTNIHDLNYLKNGFDNMGITNQEKHQSGPTIQQNAINSQNTWQSQANWNNPSQNGINQHNLIYNNSHFSHTPEQNYGGNDSNKRHLENGAKNAQVNSYVEPTSNLTGYPMANAPYIDENQANQQSSQQNYENHNYDNYNTEDYDPYNNYNNDQYYTNPDDNTINQDAYIENYQQPSGPYFNAYNSEQQDYHTNEHVPSNDNQAYYQTQNEEVNNNHLTQGAHEDDTTTYQYY
jgi:hypothetical protein